MLEHVVRAHAVVHLLPQPRDVSRVLAEKQRFQLLPHDRDDRPTDGCAADSALRLAAADQAFIGLDAYERHVESLQTPEVARVLVGLRDGTAQPGGGDIGDLHYSSPP